MRRLFFIAALVVPMALAAVATAAEPTRQTVTVHRVINPFVSCPGFAVVGTFDITRDMTTYYNEDGMPVMEIIHADITGTLTNAVTGYYLPTAGVRVFHIDLVTGEEFTTASNNFTKLPTGGVANGGAGRLVFDAQGHLVEHSGPDSAEQIVELCAALAG